MDADREGFLRSETSLIQTMGRAARNLHGRAILYADVETRSIKQALAETGRRRKLQEIYNTQHGLTPESIKSRIHDVLSSIEEVDYVNVADDEQIPAKDLESTVKRLEEEMLEAASNLEFERAADLRDRIKEVQERMLMTGGLAGTATKVRAGKEQSRGRKEKGRKYSVHGRKGSLRK
jgi:excinuclease ABC subunit B